MTHQGSFIVGALLALAMGMSGPAGAQVITASPAFTGPDLTVQGHGEIKTKADMALLTVAVTTTAHQEVAAAQDNATKTSALIGAIQRLNIPNGDIQTLNYSVGRQFDTTGRIPVLTGFDVTNTVLVRLHDLSQASRLIDAATASGATKITDLTYGLSDHQAAENQALAQAIANARSRAQAIAAAMSVTLGSLRSVNDSAGAQIQTAGGAVAYYSVDGQTAGTSDTPISAQEITVTADVSIDYSLGATSGVSTPASAIPLVTFNIGVAPALASADALPDYLLADGDPAKVQAALTAKEQQLAGNPNDPLTLAATGFLLYQQGADAQGTPYFREASYYLKSSPQLASERPHVASLLQLALGVSFERRNLPDQAREHYTKATLKDPVVAAYAHYRLALFYSAQPNASASDILPELAAAKSADPVIATLPGYAALAQKRQTGSQ